MKQNNSRKEYMVNYVRTHQRKYSISLMKTTDKELIEKLSEEKSINALVKNLLKEHYGIK